MSSKETCDRSRCIRRACYRIYDAYERGGYEAACEAFELHRPITEEEPLFALVMAELKGFGDGRAK